MSPFQGTWFESWFDWVPAIFWLFGKMSVMLLLFLVGHVVLTRTRFGVEITRDKLNEAIDVMNRRVNPRTIRCNSHLTNPKPE